MPTSRGRNKRKKKSNSKINKGSKLIKGIEFKLDGKTVTIKNKRSKEQHNQFITDLLKNRPQTWLFIEMSIKRIIEIFNSYDNFQLLGFLSYNHFLHNDDPNDDGLAEVTLEYAASFATAIKGNPTLVPTKKVFEELLNLLIDVRGTYNAFISTEVIEEKHNELESNLRLHAILNSLHTRGDGYMNHVYEYFKELFSGHDHFFYDNFGYKSADILEAIIQLEDSFLCRTILNNNFPHHRSLKRFKEWQDSEGIKLFKANDLEPMKQYLKVNPDIVSIGNRPTGFNINDPQQSQELYKIRFRKEAHKAVIDSIHLSFGDNHDFLNPKFSGLPLNETLITKKPIIKHENNYYIFPINVLTRNLIEITESLIYNKDKNYFKNKYLGNKYTFSRDNYVEKKTSKLFMQLIPGAMHYPNLKYKPGILDENNSSIETEIDLIIISDKANYLIEIKAGGLSAPSRRGALKSLHTQLSDTIGYAAKQSFRAFEYIIKDSQNKFYDSQGRNINVDPTKKTFRITITLAHLSGILSNLDELKSLEIINSNVDFAWNCSLFDLMVFSEILESEDDFINYLEQRIPLFSNSKVYVNDETDLLGLFMKNQKFIDDKVLKKVDTYILTKSNHLIDNFYQKKGEKPRKEI